ncbi:MAG: 23S rRNA (adenine(2503)-C(2))-methyltransferase RlmN [Candidatus Sericytochromatia bacterium]|nr:23S rRNA (adenine(2503)-C(2))-methyltransferase RlmN [Candidatus Sericytochromatia bacterium]
MSQNTRLHLAGLAPADLEAFVTAAGEPAYRSRQLARWIFKESCFDPGQMSDLPASFREWLDAHAEVGRLNLLQRREARDGTRKYLFGHQDGTLESVLMPYGEGLDGPDRVTACISTQVGCAVGCAFCATGLAGFQRNVTAGDMVEQVLRMQAEAGHRITNVVFMGMGEPFLNYDETLSAVHLLNKSVGIGMRHLTLSTSGIVPGIRRLAGERLQLTLAVSVHAPDDDLRDRLVPVNRKYPMAELREAMADYFEETGRRLSIEYVLLEGINDAVEQARALSRWIGDLPVHVNLIPFNATDTTFKVPSPVRVRAFREVLEQAGHPATVRRERGAEIDGACGQLRRRYAEGQPVEARKA